MRLPAAAPCFVALVLATASPALADVVNVPASADTSLISEDGARSAGGDPGLFVGFTQNSDERRALLRFDVASLVPSGSIINSVTLNIEITRASGASTAELHTLSAAWQEGTVVGSGGGSGGGVGGPADPGDATWTHRTFDTILWASPGGDFGAAALASAVLPSAGASASFSSAAMTVDVQSWLDTPATNLGWIMIASPGSTGARRFGSRESGASPPQLTVDFSAPGTTGACCSDNGSCSVVDDPGTTCVGTYQGLGVSCSLNLCPAPSGACCLPNAQGTCQLENEVDCQALDGTFQGDNTACADQSCPVILEPFVDPLPRPKIATPTEGQSGGAASYRIAAVELSQKLHRDLPATTVWGYDDGTGGTYPGPTISATSGEPVSVTWANDLRDPANVLRTEHVLEVDTCPHGVNDASPRTVVHLHGGHVAAAYDGYPEDTILPGNEQVFEYPNAQDGSTLWYHDHALGITRLNVYMGLAGFYLLRDAAERALNLPAGDYDIPLVIQDRTFNTDGSLRYPAQWRPHVIHDTILVNGKVWPFLDVDKGKYRFRVLNGSGTRTYQLQLSDGQSFSLIGSDGGLLPAPVPVFQLVLAPGERAEIVIDFANYATGEEVILQNSAPSPFPGSPGQGVVPDVMKFVVGNAGGFVPALPPTLRSIAPLDQSDLAAERDFSLNRSSDTCSLGDKWLINGLGWDDITERPRLGTTEVWRFINDTQFMHPMHMHLVFFQVLDTQNFERVDGEVVPVGAAFPPSPNQGGWQDTVQVAPGQMVRVIAKFEDYTGKFAYHCHILEHEDHEMMRQFETFTECGDGALGMPDEQCDDGGQSATCNVDCTLSVCGDGIVNALAGETCDDGNTINDADCNADCTLPLVDPEQPSGDGGGCGCGSTGASGGAGGLLVFAALLLFLRRRKQSTTVEVGLAAKR